MGARTKCECTTPPFPPPLDPSASVQPLIPLSDMASTSSPDSGDSGLGSRDFFMRVFEELKSVIIDEFVPAYGLPKEAATWMAGMIDYNVPGACAARWKNGPLRGEGAVVACAGSCRQADQLPLRWPRQQLRMLLRAMHCHSALPTTQRMALSVVDGYRALPPTQRVAFSGGAWSSAAHRIVGYHTRSALSFLQLVYRR